MENPYENVEGAARWVLEQFEVPVTTTGEEDIQALLENLREGKCQACGSDLGKNTVLIVQRTGPVAGYCSGPCLQDQILVGWIQEQHSELVTNIHFRNPENGADEASEG